MRDALLLRVVGAAGMLLLVAVPALAQDNFCRDATACARLQIKNQSAVVVKSVKITQEKTGDACDEVKNTYTQNLAAVGGGQTGMKGESFKISVYPTCKYKIQFRTTSGCTGDKTTHMAPEDFTNGKTTAALQDGCGSLNAITF